MAIINGTSGDDTLTGTSGNDTIYGLDGDDELTGGGGDDALDGGNGFDKAYFINISTGDVVVNLATGTASGPETGHDTLANIESVYASGAGNVSVTGDGGDNFISASSGKTFFVSGGAGNDAFSTNAAPGSVVDGGSGQNAWQVYLAYRNTGAFNGGTAPRTTAVQATFTPGVSGNIEGVSYSNITYLGLTTGSGNDSITFIMPQATPSQSGLVPPPYSSLFNFWNAGDGTDTVTVDMSGYTSQLTTIAIAPGTLNIASFAGGQGSTVITLMNVENYHLIGGSGDDTFRTGNGNDILTGGGGNDILDGGQGTDIARYSGLRSDYQVDQLAVSTFRVTDLRPGSPDGTDMLYNIDLLQWGDGSLTANYNTAPILTGLPVVALPGQTLALSSMFTVTDFENNAITRYQLWDGSRDAGSGYFTINGVVQAAGTVIDITAAQLSQVSWVTGSTSEVIQVRAYDGDRWSAQDTDAWSPFAVTINHAPVVTTGNKRAGANQTLALSSLISVSDADQDLIYKYQLWDDTRDPNSGHFVVNGVAQAAGTAIEVYSTQIDQVSFVTGSVGDGLEIRAFDGIQWSAADNATWSPFSITINRAPVLTTSNVNLAAGQSLSLSSLFSVSDPEGDTITKYQIWDGSADANSGHFTLNGAPVAARTVLEITAAQLAQTSFVAGTVNDSLQIRAFDGTSWSAADNASWAPFAIGPTVNRAPVVSTSPVSATHGQTLVLSSLFSVTDADGDTIQKYQLWDSTRDPASGHFVVNGVAQPAATVIEISAAQLSQTSFVTGAVGDSLQIRAFDGTDWSAGDNATWSTFTITVPANAAPVVTAANVSEPHFQTLALSSLFSVSDADGDTITKYQLWDSTRDPASGHFVVNGVAQSAATVIEISAAQLAQTSFVTGSVGDMLQVRAFDGIGWSAADNAAWAPFSITVPANNAPVVTTANVTRAHQQTLALSSLFSVSDADSDTITRYQLWDSTRDPASGYFVVNGVAQSAATVIDITAAQLTQTSFVTGAVGDNLQIRAFDGIDWSAAENASWSPFTITVPANNAPVVTTANVTRAHQQTLALSSLFSVSDADSDTITKYQLWDSSRDPASGHFVVAGVAQSAATVIEISAAQLTQTSFVTGTVGDNLQIRAFDGITWSAGDNAAWSPFTITVPANSAPVVTTSDINTTAGQSLALSTLFTATDADGDTLTRYQLWDSTRDPASGHFVVGGVDQPASTVIDITAAQLSQTSFLTGTVGDSLQIRAFDGTAWSAADNASWSPFHVAV